MLTVLLEMWHVLPPLAACVDALVPGLAEGAPQSSRPYCPQIAVAKIFYVLLKLHLRCSGRDPRSERRLQANKRRLLDRLDRAMQLTNGSAKKVGAKKRRPVPLAVHRHHAAAATAAASAKEAAAALRRSPWVRDLTPSPALVPWQPGTPSTSALPSTRATPASPAWPPARWPDQGFRLPAAMSPATSLAGTGPVAGPVAWYGPAAAAAGPAVAVVGAAQSTAALASCQGVTPPSGTVGVSWLVDGRGAGRGESASFQDVPPLCSPAGIPLRAMDQGRQEGVGVRSAAEGGGGQGGCADAMEGLEWVDEAELAAALADALLAEWSSDVMSSSGSSGNGDGGAENMEQDTAASGGSA